MASFLLFFVPVSAAASIDLDRFNEVYSLCPKSVRSTFEKTGWEVVVLSSDKLAELYSSDFGDTAGVTVYVDRKIYLSDKGNFAYVSVNHEMGHYFDYLYGNLFGGVMPSQSKDFEEIYDKEAFEDKYFEDYTVLNKSEYFAQAFKYYCEDADALKNRPLTYSFVLGTIEDMDKIYKRGFFLTEDPSILTSEITSTSKKDKKELSSDAMEVPKIPYPAKKSVKPLWGVTSR